MLTPPLRKLSPEQYREIVKQNPHLIRPRCNTGFEREKTKLSAKEKAAAHRTERALDPSETWLSAKESCEYVGCSSTTLARYYRLGILRRELVERRTANYFCRAYYYTKTSLDKLKQQKEGSYKKWRIGSN